MKISSKSIKDKAQELGFHKVGITQAVETKRAQNYLEKWLFKENHASMEWMMKRKNERGNIHNYFPEAKSVISVAMNYYTGKNQSDINSKYKFSNYAWGDDYHKILKKRIYELLRWIKEESLHTKGLVCVDTSPVMDKVWAQKAGLGWIGKHTNLISREYGSWIFLGELILDIALEYDQPFNEDLCGSCIACIDACPTQALNQYSIDAGKCISYMTIEYRGDFKSKEDLDGWIYGCDICQEVCPWNEKFSIKTDMDKFEPREEIINYTNKDWENLTQEKFTSLFKGSAVKRTKYNGLRRNIENNNNNE
tara:strand:+ start:710 stop:1633 length:924 start_codon:yes stop_codon:yes gene_type:complete